MSTRTRERTTYEGLTSAQQQVYDYTEYAWSATGPWNRLYGPNTTTTNISTVAELICKKMKYSKLTDVVETDRTHKSFKECTHDTVQHSSRLNSGFRPIWVTTVSASSPWRRYTAAVNVFPAECYARLYARDEQDAVSTAPRTFNVDGALKTAYEQMKPRSGDVSGDLGFLVFIAELRDFKSLIQRLRHPIMALHALRKSVNEPPTNLGQVVELITRKGAEGRLLLKFAVEPLIADLKTLQKSVLGIQQYIDQWNRDAAAGTLYVRHHDLEQYMSYSKFWKNSYTSSASLVTCGSSSVPVWKYIDNQYVVKAYAHLWYYPERIDNSSVTELRHQFDALGIGNIGSNIWNIIPFSFLLDYFVTTDKFFAQFQKDCVDMPYRAVGMGYSIKEQFITSATATCSGCSGTAVRVKQRYIRRRVPLSQVEMTNSSIDWNLLQIDLPSLGQWTNVIALIRLMLGRK